MNNPPTQPPAEELKPAQLAAEKICKSFSLSPLFVSHMEKIIKQYFPSPTPPSPKLLDEVVEKYHNMAMQDDANCVKQALVRCATEYTIHLQQELEQANGKAGMFCEQFSEKCLENESLRSELAKAKAACVNKDEALKLARDTTHADELYPWTNCICSICKALSPTIGSDFLKEKDTDKARIKELEVHLADANKGARINTLVSQGLAIKNNALMKERDELVKDKERLDWLSKQASIAFWSGYFSDSEYNIKLGRAGADITTVSSMDNDGHEVDKEIGHGNNLRQAIDYAMQTPTKEGRK